MDLSSAISIAADFIAARESFSPSPYWDVNGYAIGYGNHYWEDGSSVSSGDGPISETRARQLLEFYAGQNASAIAAQLSASINSNQLAALTSIRYNCGTITTSLRDLVNSGAGAAAVADRIRDTCITSGGIYNPDLVDRRELEAELYLSPPGVGTAALLVVVLGLGLFALFSK